MLSWQLLVTLFLVSFASSQLESSDPLTDSASRDGIEIDPLKNGTSLLKIDSSVQPQMKVYFFNVTNPSDFLEGEKPIFHEIGPYVYNEKWEKVNPTWHPNGTISYQPSRTFFFNRQLSSGDESDLVQTLNIPLISAANQMRYAVRFTRLALGSMLGILNQETFAVRSVRDLMWGYDDSLFKFAKDVMPPENTPPHDLFGFFVGKNGSASDGFFTISSSAKSMGNYAAIDNWNGRTVLPFWHSDRCNGIVGTDGELTPNTTIHMFNPELCRSLPLVYYKDVVHNGVDGYRFGPPINTFDTPETNPDNACFCPSGLMERDGNCGTKGLFNISSCKFGAPLSLSWPHFLHGDPKLLEDVVGLNPDVNRHEFFMDFQPKLTIAVSASARMQVNLMLSKVDDIKQVAGLREMAFPLFWFESGIDPDE